MLKIDFLKAVGLGVLALPLAATREPVQAATLGDADVLVGLWDATVAGSATYRYIYSIARGSYTATGNIDENYMNFKYSPTMGAYARNADGSFKYRERGYVFDMKGANVGFFTSIGTFRLEAGGNSFRGPGTFTQSDLHGKVLVAERFTLSATRVGI